MPQGDLGGEVAGLRGDVQVRHGGEEEFQSGSQGLRARGNILTVATMIMILSSTMVNIMMLR